MGYKASLLMGVVVIEVLDTGVNEADVNMAIDAELLESLESRREPLLHLYEWKDRSATYGYFVKPEEYLDLAAVKRRGLNLARRPTGGGIIFHEWDLAFSVLVPEKSPFFSLN